MNMQTLSRQRSSKPVREVPTETSPAGGHHALCEVLPSSHFHTLAHSSLLDLVRQHSTPQDRTVPQLYIALRARALGACRSLIDLLERRVHQQHVDDCGL